MLSDVLSLPQWNRELGMGDGWVNFGGRDDIVERVEQHLLGRGRPNVLHIAGLSGIGKSRTVFEACSRKLELAGVFYVESFEQVDRGLYKYLEQDGRHVQLVIDETSLDEADGLRSRVSEFADRLRVVTICPSKSHISLRR